MVGVRGRRHSRGILAPFERGKQRMNEYTVIEKHDGWAEVVLARPARKNAIVPPMAKEVATAVNGLSTQQDVAAIVIRGSDGAFCSGVDLKVLQAKEGDPDYLGEWDGEALREMHYALYRSTKPLIGVLERFAINAGAALVFACDLVVAGESSFLQIGEIQQGSDIPMNAGWLNVRTSEAVMARLDGMSVRFDEVQGVATLRSLLVGESPQPAPYLLCLHALLHACVLVCSRLTSRACLRGRGGGALRVGPAVLGPGASHALDLLITFVCVQALGSTPASTSGQRWGAPSQPRRLADAEIELGLILRPKTWKRRKDLHFEAGREPLALRQAPGGQARLEASGKGSSASGLEVERE